MGGGWLKLKCSDMLLLFQKWITILFNFKIMLNMYSKISGVTAKK